VEELKKVDGGTLRINAACSHHAGEKGWPFPKEGKRNVKVFVLEGTNHSMGSPDRKSQESRKSRFALTVQCLGNKPWRILNVQRREGRGVKGIRHIRGRGNA